MTKFLILSLITSNHHKKSSFSPISSEISHEDDYHLLLQCLPGWIMSQDMHWVFWHAQIGPTGWNYHEENLNFNSDYKQSPQEIIVQADLLSNFSWGSLSSTFKVPARLNSVPKHALSSLTCSDGANRLELSWPNFSFWVWLQAITTRNRLSSQSPLKFLMYSGWAEAKSRVHVKSERASDMKGALIITKDIARFTREGPQATSSRSIV